MALVKCPECGKENVSDGAKACPGCGYYIKAHFTKLNLKREKPIDKSREILDEAGQKKLMIIIAIITIFVVCVILYVGIQNQEQQKLEEYKINLAAQTCSINNRKDAIIDQIEGMSSFEQYMNHIEEQGRSIEEGFDTFSRVCLKALSVKHGIDNIEPVEFTGEDTNLVDAFKYYSNMYEVYNSFYSLIDNPYLPAQDYMDEIYTKAEEISTLYILIQKCYGTSNLEEYAVKNGSYYMYYINKQK